MVIFHSFLYVYQRVNSFACKRDVYASGFHWFGLPIDPVRVAVWGYNNQLCQESRAYNNQQSPLVNIQKTMKHHHFLWENPL